MPKPYQVWLRKEAFDYLESQEDAERQRLIAWLEKLGSHAEEEGDFVEHGSDGRVWQGVVIATHAIFWWVDSPVREVKVILIRQADI